MTKDGVISNLSHFVFRKSVISGAINNSSHVLLMHWPIYYFLTTFIHWSVRNEKHYPGSPVRKKINFIGGFYHLFLLICSVLLWSRLLLFATRAYGQTHADENTASWGSRIVPILRKLDRL
ncbi:hypothetical protein KIF59_16795 [Enterobacter cloacae subsp. cloacae]|nr:hypothetical protein [Enterobacter cloacae subsp. cloacae]